MLQIKRKILMFLFLYFVVLGGIGVGLYLRYQTLIANYTDVHVREFDQRIENYQSIYQTMIENYHTLFVDNSRVSAILAEARSASASRQNELRQELFGYTGKVFETLKQLDINIFFFHLPDSIAFLRVHEPDHYGDSLRAVRESVNMAQRERSKIIAFEVGKYNSGFRTIYPIFHEREFAGTVEIAYPFLAFKKQAMLQGSGSYGMILKRSLVETKAVRKKDGKYYEDNALFGPDYFEDKASALTLDERWFEKAELQTLLQQNRDRLLRALAQEKLQGVVLETRGEDLLLILKPIQEIGGKHAGYMLELTRHHSFYQNQWTQFLELLVGVALLLAALFWYIYRYYRSISVLEQYKKAIDFTLIVSKANTDGIITYANDRFAQISGYTKEELLGEPHNIIRHPDTPSEIFADLWKSIRHKKTWQGILKNRAKDGREYYVKSTIFPILDEHGDITEYMGLREDVTELIHANQREEQLRLEAQRSEMAKMDFLANMSHEIRTPLNGIMGFARLLYSADLPQEHHQQAKIIVDQGKMLLGIINDILDLSKIESGHFELEKVAINPFVEFEAAFNLFKPLVDEKGIKYRIFIDSTISESIGIDSLRLKQVMSNLISNAIKFTPSGGEVSVEVHRVANPHGLDRLKFGVRDTGIGIAPEKIASIFTPFTQEDSSTTRHFGGTGLGLSISAKLVEMFGGALVVESVKGEGSYFWFEVEVMECNRQEVLALKLKESNIGVLHSVDPHYHYVKTQLETFHVSFIDCDQSVMEEIDSSGKKFHLLIVFEEAMLIKLLEKVPHCYERILMIGRVRGNYTERVIIVDEYENCPSHLYNILLSLDLEGMHANVGSVSQKQWPGRNVLVVEDYEVNQILIEALLNAHAIIPDFADNGKSACEMIEAKEYDLVLMDVNMPVMDGINATHLIRPYHPELPIVALTANALHGDKERFIEEGMNGYLSKPIDPDALAEVLEHYLGEARQVKVNVDDMILDVPLERLSKVMLQHRAQAALGLKTAAIERMFNLFFATLEGELVSLEEAIKAENFVVIADLAHKLKGSSANLRIHELSENAKQMEMASKEGNIKACETYFERFKNELNKIE